MTAKKWDHDGLAHDLANKFRADTSMMVWENMPMGPSGSQRPDVYVLPKSFARFTPITYEVKVSVSDFRTDVTAGKWQGYLKYSAGVVFAAPAGLIAKEDVPPGCGLIIRHDEVWRTVKKPTLQRIETLPHDVWMKLLIDGIDRMTQERIKQRPSASAYWMEEKLRKKHGEEVAKLIAEALRSKSLVEHAIKQDELRRREIEEGTELYAKAHRERMEREATKLTYEQSNLAAELGLSRDATASQLCGAIRDARYRLTEDNEVQRLRGLFKQLERSIGLGLEPLPGEKAQAPADALQKLS